MALQGPRHALRAQGLRRRLQADHPRSALVSDPAAVDDHHVHGHLRQYRHLCPQMDYRSSSSICPAQWSGLTSPLPDQDQRDLCAECQPVWQGLLPAFGGAGLHFDLQPDHLPDPVRHVPGLCACILSCAALPFSPTGYGSHSRRS